MRLRNQDKESLFVIYGPLLGGKDLVSILGFRTAAAFRQAIRLNRVGVTTFTIEGRRGRFAFTVEVEEWLESLKKEKGT